MKRMILTALAALFIISVSEASAQSVSANGDVSITIAKVVYIGVPSADVNFSTPVNSDFAAGEIAADNTVLVNYGSNAPHDLQVSLDDLGSKDVGDLQWSTDGSNFTGMTTSAADVESNGTGGLNNTTLSFKMLLDWETDTEGTYSGTITYTVVAN